MILFAVMMTNNITIRKVTFDDLAVLVAIGRQTFHQAFADDNDDSDMNEYLNKAFSIEQITHELHEKNSEFYFAVFKKQIVGYLKINLGHSVPELVSDQSLQIERIYVKQEFQGNKIGQQLFQKALDIARSTKAEYIWLSAWELNSKAIAFYKKIGFKAFGKRSFLLGSDEQTDLLMKVTVV